MITDYLNAAMHLAQYEFLSKDKLYYGEIKEIKGLYATAPTLELCRDQLLSTLEDWVLFSIHKNIPLPSIDNLDLQIKDSVDT